MAFKYCNPNILIFFSIKSSRVFCNLFVFFLCMCLRFFSLLLGKLLKKDEVIYSEHLDNHRLDSVINILLFLGYHMSVCHQSYFLRTLRDVGTQKQICPFFLLILLPWRIVRIYKESLFKNVYVGNFSTCLIHHISSQTLVQFFTTLKLQSLSKIFVGKEIIF